RSPSCTAPTGTSRCPTPSQVQRTFPMYWPPYPVRSSSSARARPTWTRRPHRPTTPPRPASTTPCWPTARRCSPSSPCVGALLQMPRLTSWWLPHIRDEPSAGCGELPVAVAQRLSEGALLDSDAIEQGDQNEADRGHGADPVAQHDAASQ